MEHLLKRAIDGDSKAQLDLGLCLLSGCCGPRDLPSGIRWIIRAAEAGQTEARTILEEFESVTGRHIDAAARCVQE